MKRRLNNVLCLFSASDRERGGTINSGDMTVTDDDVLNHYGSTPRGWYIIFIPLFLAYRYPFDVHNFQKTLDRRLNNVLL